MTDTLKFYDTNANINKINADLLHKLIEAQSNLLTIEYNSAYEFIMRVIDDLKLNLKVYSECKDLSSHDFSNKSYKELVVWSKKLLDDNTLPKHTQLATAEGIANRIQLVKAFSRPDESIEAVKQKVIDIVSKFPKQASDIECGKNKGDVIDPYILAATQYLLFGGNFEPAIGATVAHKALMMIEGLLGHLHEDVLGYMRGNARAPEPRGEDQEQLSFISNPFPGADVIQPPYHQGDKIKFHQIKSKSGSAKGGDGARLGQQLLKLEELYDAEIYYHALIGNTLVGHRSKTGVEKAASNVVVLIGNASFKVLTNSDVGPELLLRLYQTAFQQSAETTGYRLETISQIITEDFVTRANERGEGFLEEILHVVTSGNIEFQDSRLFNVRKTKK